MNFLSFISWNKANSVLVYSSDYTSLDRDDRRKSQYWATEKFDQSGGDKNPSSKNEPIMDDSAWNESPADWTVCNYSLDGDWISFFMEILFRDGEVAPSINLAFGLASSSSEICNDWLSLSGLPRLHTHERLASSVCIMDSKFPKTVTVREHRCSWLILVTHFCSSV